MSSGNTVTLHVNQSVSITSIVSDAYGAASSAKTINYISDDPTIVILANNGVFVPSTVPINSVSTNIITGLKNGIATITVTIDGGAVINTIVVTVNSPPPAEISFVLGTPAP